MEGRLGVMIRGFCKHGLDKIMKKHHMHLVRYAALHRRTLVALLGLFSMASIISFFQNRRAQISNSPLHFNHDGTTKSTLMKAERDGEEPGDMYEARKDVISHVCADYLRRGFSPTFRNQPLQHLIVSDEHRLLYCNIPKVASTNWKRVLLTLAYGNLSRPEDIPGDKAHVWKLPTLNEFAKEEAAWRLRDYFKFLFVRHPFARLYSAWRDKFSKPDPYYNQKFGTRILRMFRPWAGEQELASGAGVTLEEFLRYIAHPTTFAQDMDHHWGRYFTTCNPCLVDYHLVGFLETLSLDAANVFQMVNISGEHLRFPGWPAAGARERFENGTVRSKRVSNENAGVRYGGEKLERFSRPKDYSPSAQASAAPLEMYLTFPGGVSGTGKGKGKLWLREFRTLPTDLVDQLYNIYQVDFEMFKFERL